MEEKTKVKKKSSSFELVEVPTQMGIAIKCNDTEKLLSTDEAIVEILNKVTKIEKILG